MRETSLECIENKTQNRSPKRNPSASGPQRNRPLVSFSHRRSWDFPLVDLCSVFRIFFVWLCDEVQSLHLSSNVQHKIPLYIQVRLYVSVPQHLCHSNLGIRIACTASLLSAHAKHWQVLRLNGGRCVRCRHNFEMPSLHIQPRDSVVTRNTDHQRRSSWGSDFVHAPQVDQACS